MDTIASKPCGRCGGSGRHSFNLRDLDMCYGCGGSGRVLATPKGQKAIRPTAALQDCKAGDIIKFQMVLYRVNRIQWCKPTTRGNQAVRVTRLVDDKAFILYRSATHECVQGYGCTSDPSGTKTYYPSARWIEVTPDMIGQDTDVTHIRMTTEERETWMQWVSDKTGTPVDRLVVR